MPVDHRKTVVGPSNALVRNVPQSYVGYYAGKGRAVDGKLASLQHQRYVAALEAAGLQVASIDADENFPDCVFIEDTTVLSGGHALIASLQNENREGEQPAVEAVLRKTHKIVRVEPKAKLDGGDVMRVGDTFYVGLSDRTNQAGVNGLKSFAADFGIRTVAVPVKHCLHLKTGVTYLGNGTLLAAPGWFDMNCFKVREVILTDQGEEGAANCLRIHDHLLIAEGYPKTSRRLRQFAARHGLHLTSLTVTEFQKADGSLTCMSLIW